MWRDQKKNSELPTEKVKAGLDVLRKMGVIEIVLSGGNPLLRDDIGEIIDYATQYFVTTIYDNGSQAAKNIDVLRNIDFVAISLDTLNEKKYDYLKGVKGAWKNAINAVQTLHDEGITVGVSPTISQLNMNEILDFTEHFTSRAIPVLYCLYQHDTLAHPLFQIGEKDKELEIVDKGAFGKVCDELIKKKNEQDGILITKKMLRTLKGLYQNGYRTWECKALQSFFMIDPLGRVAGCHLQKPVATIFDLPKIWNSEKFNSFRRKYRKCKECSYMCYMFYSLHANVRGNIEVVRDQWRNAKMILTHKRLASIVNHKYWREKNS